MIIRRVFCWYPILMCTPKKGDNFCDRKLGTKMVRNRVSDFFEPSLKGMRPTNFEGNKTRLVGGFMNFIFNIWDVIRPIDELIFFKMV